MKSWGYGRTDDGRSKCKQAAAGMSRSIMSVLTAVMMLSISFAGLQIPGTASAAEAASTASGAAAGETATLATASATSPVTGLEDVSADWKNFRNSDSNMAITSAAIPTSQSEAKLLWNSELEGASMWNQPNVPIIVDDSLVTTFGTKLVKMDLATGERIAESEMKAATNWGYTPLAYAEGMIFVPVAGGVQAFNAQTLESLWYYEAWRPGGTTAMQTLCPIAYSDGCIYLGWWGSESAEAEFACIDILDEDPSQSDELKTARWNFIQKGGFYWAGAVVVGDHVIVGTDNGTSTNEGTAHVYSFDKKTGDVVSDVPFEDMGDIRSSISYDSASSRIYFTTKDAHVARMTIDPATGALSNLETVQLVDSGGETLASTCTPVVYKGRVFVGAGSPVLGGTGVSTDAFFVLDESNLEMLDSVFMPGEVKSSPLLSTAHESEGYLYFYITYNRPPGGIDVVKVPASKSSRELMSVDTLYDAAGYEQYCISSPICASDGTLYYRNDSGSVLAVGTDAKTPVLKTDLSSTKSANLGETCTLSVECDPQDVSKLAYQWYSSSDGETYEPVEGATGSTFAYTPTEMGDKWFYCTVIATKGKSTASVESGRCKVTASGYVNVVFENSTYSKSDGAGWDGQKETTVDFASVDGDLNAEQFVRTAAKKLNIEVAFDGEQDVSNGEIASIDGISNGTPQQNSKWFGFVNEHTADGGLGIYDVSKGTLYSGDTIFARFSVNGGSDVYVMDGTQTTIASLAVSGGALMPLFDSGQGDYTVYIGIDGVENVSEEGTAIISVKAEPADRSLSTFTKLGDAVYGYGRSITVRDGDTLQVLCGKTSEEAQTVHTLHVKKAAGSLSVGQVQFADVSTGKIHADEVETQTISIQNTGNEKITGLSASSTSSAAFRVGRLAKTELEPGESTTLSVTTVEDTLAEKNPNSGSAVPYTMEITVNGKGALSSNNVSERTVVSVSVGGADWKRLFGDTRYQTCSAILDEGFDATGGTVIVATGQNFPDALCASGLAGALDEDGSGVPVILTESAKLTDVAESQLQRLEPSHVIISGGTSAVSEDVERQIENVTGVKPVRLYGDLRDETSLKMYEYARDNGQIGKTAIVTTGGNYADALSVSSYAYAAKCPIFLADQHTGLLASDLAQAIREGGFDNVLILGGTAAVSDGVNMQVGESVNVMRLGGEYRWNTSESIATWATGNMSGQAFKPEVKLSYDKMAVTYAWNYPDALSGASLCGVNKSIVLLVPDYDGETADDVEKLAQNVAAENKAKIFSGYVFGGTAVVSDSAMSAFVGATK